MDRYRIIFFKRNNGQKPALEYLEKAAEKDRIKILTFIENLSIYDEFRREPFSRHLSGKLRELKIDFGGNKHRMIYFFTIGKIIILLHAFSKKTNRTPAKEIVKAEKYMREFLNNILD